MITGLQRGDEIMTKIRNIKFKNQIVISKCRRSIRYYMSSKSKTPERVKPLQRGLKYNCDHI